MTGVEELVNGAGVVHHQSSRHSEPQPQGRGVACATNGQRQQFAAPRGAGENISDEGVAQILGRRVMFEKPRVVGIH